MASVSAAMEFAAARPFMTFLALLFLCYGISIVLARLRKLPPHFNYLVAGIRGKFDLKKEGGMAVIRQGFEECGEIFRMQIGYRGVTVCVGPEAQYFLFQRKDDEVGQKAVYGFTVPVFGPGVVYDAPQSVMNQQLKFLAKGLTKHNMDMHVGRIVDEAEKFFAALPDEGDINIMNAVSELIILTASRCLLGKEIRDNMKGGFAEQYERLSAGMVHLSFFWPSAPIQAHKERDQARSDMNALFEPIIRKRRERSRLYDDKKAAGEEVDVSHYKEDDLLQVLVDSKYRDGTSMTDQAIVGMLIAGLFGGQHTSNMTSTWIGFELLEKPEIMERLIKEQKEVMGDHPGEHLGLQSLGEMKFLDAVTRETLRLHPPLVALMRKVLKGIKYKDYNIPKDDIIVACPWVTHRLPISFPNKPLEFDPDRMAEPRKEHLRAKNTMITFGGGRHECLGRRFGMIQIKTIWSVILRNFEISKVPGYGMPENDWTQIVVGPTHKQCMIHFKRKKTIGTKYN